VANGRKTGGRVAGTPNKLGSDIRTMIIGALETVGGQRYLTECARSHPVAFLTLLGKLMPMQIAADGNRPMVIDFRWADEPETAGAEAQTIDADETIVRLTFDQAVPRESAARGGARQMRRPTRTSNHYASYQRNEPTENRHSNRCSTGISANRGDQIPMNIPMMGWCVGWWRSPASPVTTPTRHGHFWVPYSGLRMRGSPPISWAGEISSIYKQIYNRGYMRPHSCGRTPAFPGKCGLDDASMP
jgi:hypothetical protein